ncbi:MAG TPA: hypothetical protein VGC80_03470, partial [Acetobacteraceae bacterium]
CTLDATALEGGLFVVAAEPDQVVLVEWSGARTSPDPNQDCGRRATLRLGGTAWQTLRRLGMPG